MTYSMRIGQTGGMTMPALVDERILSGRICLVDATGEQEALYLACPGPYTSPLDRGSRMIGMLLHYDGETLWATHDECGRRFDAAQIHPSIGGQLFDLIYAQAAPDRFGRLGAHARYQELDLCVPRLLGHSEHEHRVGYLPVLQRYGMDFIDGTGHWYNSVCPNCKAMHGFIGERDPHRWRIWCGQCSHSWIEGHDPEHSLTNSLALHHTVYGELAAEAAAMELLRGA